MLREFPLSCRDAPFKLYSLADVPNPTKQLTTSLDFSSDGDYLVAANEDDVLRIFAGCPATMSGPEGTSPLVTSLFLKDSGCSQAVFASHRRDNVFVTPRNPTASDVLRVDLNRGVINGAYHSMDSVDANTSNTVDADSSIFCGLAHAPTSHVFCAVKENGYASFFHPTCAQAIATMQQPAAGVASIDFGPDGHSFCFADYWAARIYDWRKMASGPYAIVDTVSIDEEGRVCGVQFHPKRGHKDLLVTTTSMISARVHLDKPITPGEPYYKAQRLWQDNVDITEELASFKKPFLSFKRRLHCTAKWSPNGVHIATGTASAQLLVTSGLEERRYGLEFKLRPHVHTVTAVAWNPRYNVLASACSTVRLWMYEEGVVMAGSSPPVAAPPAPPALARNVNNKAPPSPTVAPPSFSGGADGDDVVDV